MTRMLGARRALAGSLAVGLAALTLPATAPAASGLPQREADAIVVTGADTTKLAGAQPDSIVAFRYGNGWRQVPVQVDERAIIDYKAVRQLPGSPTFLHEAYTDPGTHAGADPNPDLDADDEIAMMARDAGRGASGVPSPRGVARDTRTSIAIGDPLGEPESLRYIYLFRARADLDPTAGQAYVDYDFSLDSGDYKSTYDWNGVADNGAGPPANTEDSTVTTPFYSQHLLARWVTDELTVSAGGSTQVDILDGDKAQVNFGCSRSELTFSRGGGGFIVNRSGPVRAIRSYIGANSGTFTQQDRIYYDRSEVLKTYLRVHPGINTIDQFLDYSPAASGMTYRTSVDPAGVTIDGVPDSGLETGNALGPELAWEQAAGSQGTLSIVSRVETDIETFSAGSYYQDDSTSPLTPQCGGYADGQAWGSSGPGVTGVGVNTDPTLGPAASLTGTRTIFFSEPGGDAKLAELRSDQVDNPLTVTAAAEREPRGPALDLTVRGERRKLTPGGSVRIPVIAENRGANAVTGIEICAKPPVRAAAAGPCKRVDRLGARADVRVRFVISATLRARRWVNVRYSATADNAKRASVEERILIDR